MIKASLLLSILASIITLPLNAQVVTVWVPGNGTNCSPQEFRDNAPWTPPGEPSSAEHFAWINGNWDRISYSYYEYNSNGMLSAHVMADENDDLEHRWEYTYDAQGNMTEEKLYDFSPGSTPWITKYRAMYSYDSQGRYIEKTRQHYGFNQWYDMDRRNRVFDANNFQTLELTREWNDQTNTWDTSYAQQTDFTYDLNGYPLESYTKYQFNGSSWQNVDFKKYVLDATNEVIEIQIDGWNGVSYQQQELIRNITWQSTAMREMADREYHSWNGSNYIPVNKYGTVLGTCHRSKETTYEVWDGSNFVLLNTNKSEYDSDGAFTEYSLSALDTTTGTWTTTILDLGTPTYDGNGAIQEYLFQMSDSMGNLENYTKSIYAFHTSLDEASAASSISIYPSPAQDIVNLNFANIAIEDIQLFNSTGQLVESYGGTTRQLETSDLSNGVYFVAATTNDGRLLRSKFVVQH